MFTVGFQIEKVDQKFDPHKERASGGECVNVVTQAEQMLKGGAVVTTQAMMLHRSDAVKLESAIRPLLIWVN